MAGSDVHRIVDSLLIDRMSFFRVGAISASKSSGNKQRQRKRHRLLGDGQIRPASRDIRAKSQPRLAGVGECADNKIPARRESAGT